MHRFLIRFFDIVLSGIGLLLTFPIVLLIGLSVAANSGFPVFYRQVRVGRKGREFKLLKFRTMKKDADRLGELTVGGRDVRITAIGYWLRRFKLDELLQLIHVFSGKMSLVGPRPEVPRYVALYTPQQRKVLEVRPGITDEASLVYFNENELLSEVPDPEKHYREVIMADKIRLNMDFVRSPTLGYYFKTIFRTLARVLSTK